MHVDRNALLTGSSPYGALYCTGGTPINETECVELFVSWQHMCTGPRAGRAMALDSVADTAVLPLAAELGQI